MSMRLLVWLAAAALCCCVQAEPRATARPALQPQQLSLPTTTIGVASSIWSTCNLQADRAALSFRANSSDEAAVLPSPPSLQPLSPSLRTPGLIHTAVLQPLLSAVTRIFVVAMALAGVAAAASFLLVLLVNRRAPRFSADGARLPGDRFSLFSLGGALHGVNCPSAGVTPHGMSLRWAGLTPVVLLTSARRVHEYYRLTGGQRLRDFRFALLGSVCEAIMGHAVGVLHGQQWKDVRAYFNPFFEPRAAAQQLPMLQQVVRSALIEPLLAAAAASPSREAELHVHRSGVDVLPLRVLARMVYGDLSEERLQQLFHLGELHVALVDSMRLLRTRLPGFAHLPTECNRRVAAFQRAFSAFHRSLRSERSAAGYAQDCLYDHLCADLEQQSTGAMSERQAMATLDEIVLLNIDVTYVALMSALCNIAAAPAEVQHRLRNELADTHTPAAELTPQQMGKEHMPYLHAVLSESARLTPALAFSLPERAGCSVELGGLALRADSVVLVDCMAVNRDPHEFADPLHFDPSRHLTGHHSSAFHRYGMSSRQCMGQHIANNILKQALLQLLECFELRPLQPQQTTGVKTEGLPYLTPLTDFPTITLRLLQQTQTSDVVAPHPSGFATSSVAAAGAAAASASAATASTSASTVANGPAAAMAPVAPVTPVAQDAAAVAHPAADGADEHVAQPIPVMAVVPAPTAAPLFSRGLLSLDLSARPLPDRACCVLGMSIGNAFFSCANVVGMLSFLLSRFRVVFVFLPDKPAEHTFAARGCPAAKAKGKIRRDVNRYKRWISQALGGRQPCTLQQLAQADRSQAQCVLLDWECDIESLPAYTQLLAQYQLEYARCPAFRADCRATTLPVLQGQLPEGADVEAALECAKQFLLMELAFLATLHMQPEVAQAVAGQQLAAAPLPSAAAAAAGAAPSASASASVCPLTYVYHRRWPVFERLMEREYPLLDQAQPPEPMGFVIVERAA